MLEIQYYIYVAKIGESNLYEISILKLYHESKDEIEILEKIEF